MIGCGAGASPINAGLPKSEFDALDKRIDESRTRLETGRAEIGGQQDGFITSFHGERHASRFQSSGTNQMTAAEFRRAVSVPPAINQTLGLTVYCWAHSARSIRLIS